MRYCFSVEAYEETANGTNTSVTVMAADGPNEFVARQIVVRQLLCRGWWVRWIRPELIGQGEQE